MNQYKETRNQFYDQPEWTKNGLARTSPLSLAGLTKHLARLMDENYIVYEGTADSTGGRPSKRYVLNKDRSHILCVNLKAGRPERAQCKVYDLGRSELFSLQECADRLDLSVLLKAISQCTEADPCIDLAVISFPGVCADGITELGDLENLLQIDLRHAVRKHISIEFVIENDVNCATIGYSRLTGCSPVAFLYFPEHDFPGCGMVLDGRLYNGNRHFAGELRYLPEGMQTLSAYVNTLACVIAPETIVVCDERKAKERYDPSTRTIPAHLFPEIRYVEHISPFIWNGLFEIAVDALKKR